VELRGVRGLVADWKTGVRLVDVEPAEAVAGITEGGARALDRADDRGSLEEGAVGDLVVLDAPSHVHLPYQYDTDLVETVLRSGRRVVG